MTSTKLPILVALASCLASIPATTSPLAEIAIATPDAATEAFPGAVGFGQFAQGGRNGRIAYVTNLNDQGKGSLRNCVEGVGPRNCIFRVGGTINLQSPLAIENSGSYLSILGQTAPDPGISLTIDPNNNSHVKTPIYVRNAHDVIIRHLRIRLQYPSSVKNADTLTVENSKRVYLDHISGVWATDEGFSTHGDSTDITVANSIFAEGLKPHSKCALLGSDPTAPQNITFWRNACMSNNDRNPDINHFSNSCIELVNNLFYNARSEWVEVFSQFEGGTPVSVVGNYFKAGKNTSRSTSAIKWQSDKSIAPPAIYASDNLTWSPESKNIAEFSPETEVTIRPEPVCPLSSDVAVISPNEAYKTIRRTVGAFPRDEIDLRLVKDLGERGKEGKGIIPDAPGQLPPSPANTVSYVDNDQDGMADTSERQFGSDSRNYDPWAKNLATGNFAFDEFMEWLSQERLNRRNPS